MYPQGHCVSQRNNFYFHFHSPGQYKLQLDLGMQKTQQSYQNQATVAPSNYGWDTPAHSIVADNSPARLSSGSLAKGPSSPSCCYSPPASPALSYSWNQARLELESPKKIDKDEGPVSSRLRQTPMRSIQYLYDWPRK